MTASVCDIIICLFCFLTKFHDFRDATFENAVPIPDDGRDLQHGAGERGVQAAGQASQDRRVLRRARPFGTDREAAPGEYDTLARSSRPSFNPLGQ